MSSIKCPIQVRPFAIWKLFYFFLYIISLSPAIKEYTYQFAKWEYRLIDRCKTEQRSNRTNEAKIDFIRLSLFL